MTPELKTKLIEQIISTAQTEGWIWAKKAFPFYDDKIHVLLEKSRQAEIDMQDYDAAIANGAIISLDALTPDEILESLISNNMTDITDMTREEFIARYRKDDPSADDFHE